MRRVGNSMRRTTRALTPMDNAHDGAALASELTVGKETEVFDMRDDDRYFYKRAETELELAQRATHPLAVRAHYIIANHYLDRCYGGLSANDEDGSESSTG